VKRRLQGAGLTPDLEALDRMIEPCRLPVKTVGMMGRALNSG